MVNFNDDIEKSVDILQKGRILLYPTDTIWGLGCDATCESAVNKIFEIKKRNESKSLIVLVRKASEIAKYTDSDPSPIFNYLKKAKRPTTAIYPNARNLPGNVINKDGTVGIRIVEDIFCKELIQKFGKPIISTSANISGAPNATVFAAIDSQIKNQVDYIVNYRQKEMVPATASTIIKLEANGLISIIRP